MFVLVDLIILLLKKVFQKLSKKAVATSFCACTLHVLLAPSSVAH